jgi:signal transduction histidine kinase/ligand-binding sensor domain-containing protein/DNA-binding response OmpR family regulator
MRKTKSIVRIWVLISLVLTTMSPYVHSQNPHLAFETLSVEQGAPIHVSCILQDETGFLWIGTWSGLCRYDGYSFMSYKHDPDDTSSIADNMLSTLYEDKSGVLWIGCRLGLDKLDKLSGTFKHYVPNPSATGGDKSNSVWDICEGKDGGLWIGTGDDLCRFDRARGEFTYLRHDSAGPGSVSDIYEGRDGSLWFGTATGLAEYDFETGKFKHFWSDPGNRDKLWLTNTSAHWVKTIYGDDTGILWLGTNGGLVEHNPKEGTFFNYRYGPTDLFNPQHPENRFTSICQDVVSGVLWIGSSRGLFSFDPKSKKFVQQLDEGVTSVYSERSGTLWVGTNTAVKKLNRTKLPFRKYPMGDIACTLVNGSAGKLWVYAYTKGGWLQFDPRTERFVPYSFGTDYLYFVYPEGDLSLLARDGSSYIRDTLGNITFSLGPSWKDFNHSLSFGCKTSRGYYAGTHDGGLYLRDPRTQRVTKVTKLKRGIYFIYEDRLGSLWVATRGGGLFRYDQANNTFAEFVSDNRNPSSVSGREINQIYEDKKGRLWFATISGLDRYERSTSGFSHFTARNGLPSDNIRGILEDDHGYLWLNTAKGIVKFDPETHHLRSYDVSYGLELPSDVYYGLGCKARNGEMFFGGATGFTRFHPDSVRDNPYIPPVVITSFRKFDKPYPLASEIRTPYNENFISFEFAALSYVSPERNQYAYKMEGVDEVWVYSGTRRYASYPNLDPGEYVFRVKGSNNEGGWNEAATSVAIVISPPWWKNVWAYGFYALVVLSLGYYVWKMQVKRIRIRHEYEMIRFEAAKLHEVDQMKSRFFANISHEFRTPLTLILGPVKQMIDASEDERAVHELRVVHKNASRLLNLVHQLLDLAKLESGNMKLQAVPRNIVPLVKGLTQSFCSYAERKRITLNVTSTNEEIVAYIDVDKIEKILTNILSNAFKFTPEGGVIEVSVIEDKQYVNVRISDTGIGIPAEKIPAIFDRFYQVDGSHTREQEGTGIGLSLTRELVELHKGKIEVESQEGRGTTVTVRIALGKDHLKPDEICGSGEEEEKDSCLPELVSRDEETEARNPRAYASAGSHKPVLLIVEDNADVREYISKNLCAGYRILEATDGEDGWNKSSEEMPDIIVSDVMMPRMDGFELCTRLKTDERTSHIPVILLTAKASSQDKIEGFETGADDYIMKPFEPAELEARLRNLIDQRERLHEHFRKHGLVEIEQERITPLDQRFLQKLFTVIGEHMSDASFGVETLANLMAASRSTLLKKVEALIGEPPNAVIRRTRLNKAARLIEGGFGNISEVALEVGFNNPSYFAESFRRQFGMNPSEYHRNPSNPQISTGS